MPRFGKDVKGGNRIGDAVTSDEFNANIEFLKAHDKQAKLNDVQRQHLKVFQFDAQIIFLIFFSWFFWYFQIFSIFFKQLYNPKYLDTRGIQITDLKLIRSGLRGDFFYLHPQKRSITV